MAETFSEILLRNQHFTPASGMSEFLEQHAVCRFVTKGEAFISDEPGAYILLLEGILKIHVSKPVCQSIMRILPGEFITPELHRQCAGNENIAITAEQNSIAACIDSGFNRKVEEKWPEQVAEMRAKTMQTLLERLSSNSCYMEDRIMRYLEELSNQSGSRSIPVTHAVIAEELGTVREVVSRAVKKLEKRGKLKLHRGKLTIS